MCRVGIFMSYTFFQAFDITACFRFRGKEGADLQVYYFSITGGGRLQTRFLGSGGRLLYERPKMADKNFDKT